MGDHFKTSNRLLMSHHRPSSVAEGEVASCAANCQLRDVKGLLEVFL